MPWLQIHTHSTPEQVPQLEDILLACGAMVVTLEDLEDNPIYEPELNSTPLWQRTRVTGLFEADVEIAAIQKTLADTSGSLADPLTPAISFKIDILEDKDWERQWMENYHPLQCGKRLWICPSWRDVPDPNAITLMLDPGLAFGTGTHPTTALCLQWLDSIDCTNKTVLDYGCGSGILGISALLLGARKLIGIDIDPQAVESTLANAERNHINPDCLDIKLSTAISASPMDTAQADTIVTDTIVADIVVANILAGPLIELAQTLVNMVAVGGQLALSGILATQAQSVIDAYSPWLQIDTIAEQDEWIRITATKIE